VGVLHDFRCLEEGCETVFEAVYSRQEESGLPRCKKCKSGRTKKIVAFRNSSPTFTEKIYPFYHVGIGEVVHSEKALNKRCSDLGFNSKHEGAIMTPKHERKILAKRVDRRPREVVEAVTWSGKGEGLPTFETHETKDS
jgi:hypothetical protein|tara:strand:+ start:5121 stop:5537 length:417 start_codon:yes stop_codon:yes gene_type:complete